MIHVLSAGANKPTCVGRRPQSFSCPCQQPSGPAHLGRSPPAVVHPRPWNPGLACANRPHVSPHQPTHRSKRLVARYQVLCAARASGWPTYRQCLPSGRQFHASKAAPNPSCSRTLARAACIRLTHASLSVLSCCDSFRIRSSSPAICRLGFISILLLYTMRPLESANEGPLQTIAQPRTNGSIKVIGTTWPIRPQSVIRRRR
jgi:hypothetical protein